MNCRAIVANQSSCSSSLRFGVMRCGEHVKGSGPDRHGQFQPRNGESLTGLGADPMRWSSRIISAGRLLQLLTLHISIYQNATLFPDESGTRHDYV